MPMNIYALLTRQFNQGRTRAVVAGGQAVVLHRLALMSKDGDWILREEPEALGHVLSVLAGYGARYRFGAPLDARWLAGGWSAHLEFARQGLRVRTDFVTRPARIDAGALARIWREAEGQAAPFASAADLAAMKKTNREKDYPIIGELARRMERVRDQMLYSRSARDLEALAQEHTGLVERLADEGLVLRAAAQGREALEAALDAERRQLIHTYEQRLARYLEAAKPWAAIWPNVARDIEGLDLIAAHRLIVQRADGVLPTVVPGGWP
jgi:hypothetical protein